MSANPKLHPLFEGILAAVTLPVSPKPQRIARQRMLENEVAMFAPDYNEAMELLDSLQCGLDARFNDNVGVDVTHLFKKLREALDEADDIEHRKTYDPRDQYNGDDDSE